MTPDKHGPGTRTQALRAVPRRLWRVVKLAHHRLLMLDYDGTLAPFRVRRDEARPWPRCRDALRAVAHGPGTTVAIVSGRPVSEIDELLGPLPVTVVGEHGWEKRVAAT